MNNEFIGKKLLDSSISNSFSSGLNEKCFRYIFHRFYVKNLILHEKLTANLKNLDFLDGKYFEKFEIVVDNLVSFETINFHLKVNELNVQIQHFDFHLNRNNFLKNIFVKKENFV